MISIQNRKLCIKIDFSIPLPCKYRGGGMAVFRIRDNQPEVLLGLRANNPGRGLWTFPGGMAEGREKLTTAALREFREETGIQLYGRHITRTGLFQIKTFFFEWNTLIVESNQEFDLAKRFNPNKGKSQSGTVWEDCYSYEFISMRWVPLSEIKNLKLHRWVSDVVDFYTSGKMKPYAAKPPKCDVKPLPKPKKINRARTVKWENRDNLLFDMAEMVLTKVSRDGTRYYQPAYQPRFKYPAISEALYGV